MKQVLEEVVKERSKELGKVGMKDVTVEAPTNSPYDRVGAELYNYRITIEWNEGSFRQCYFYIKLMQLPGCCGVIELNRPSCTGTAKQFDAVMNCVMEALQRLAHPPKGSYADHWGNQILATTSAESNQAFVGYVIRHRWPHFKASRNPRTGNAVTIWRKVV